MNDLNDIKLVSNECFIFLIILLQIKNQVLKTLRSKT